MSVEFYSTICLPSYLRAKIDFTANIKTPVPYIFFFKNVHQLIVLWRAFLGFFYETGAVTSLAPKVQLAISLPVPLERRLGANYGVSLCLPQSLGNRNGWLLGESFSFHYSF